MLSFLHRHIWQNLPQNWRRSLLAFITKLTAPKPSDQAHMASPFIVVGALSSPTGLGQSARLCHDALKANGLPVFGIDLTLSLMQQSIVRDFSFEDGWSLQGPATLIIHVNAPLMPLALTLLGRRVVRHRYVIGYWAWELEALPDDWQDGRETVHEVWVPSQFTARSVQPLIAPRPCHVVPHPVALRAPSAVSQCSVLPRPFTVLTMLDATSSLARKNPLAALAAFRLAFGKDDSVRLVLKITNLDLAGEAGVQLKLQALRDANVVLNEEFLSTKKMNELFQDSDVLLSLHRSEGFGLSIAEGMLHGLPVISTCWSGEADFLDDQTAILVKHQLRPAEDLQATYHDPDQNWADPDISDAAKALQTLRSDARLRQTLGQTGRTKALQLWSAERYYEACFQNSAEASRRGVV